LKLFFDKCKESVDRDSHPHAFSGIDPEAIYRLDLMRKKDSKWIKGSLDGLVFLRFSGEQTSVKVAAECKTRASHALKTEAEDRIREHVGAELYGTNKSYCFQISSNEHEFFHSLIFDKHYKQRNKSEAFQLLHNTFISGAAKGVLLVGAENHLITAILVTFEHKLLDWYGIVLDRLYDTYFKPFYDEESVDTLLDAEAEDSAGRRVMDALEFMP